MWVIGLGSGAAKGFCHMMNMRIRCRGKRVIFGEKMVDQSARRTACKRAGDGGCLKLWIDESVFM